MSKSPLFSDLNAPLTPSVFYVLLSLSIKERHGYEIMRQVLEDSKGKVRLGPGTLYGTLKRMLDEGLVIETDERPDPQLDDERRRYYRLSDRGQKMLSAELERFADALAVAQKGKVKLSF